MIENYNKLMQKRRYKEKLGYIREKGFCGGRGYRRTCMDVNLLFKIAAVGILVTVIGQVLKHSGREEHAFLVSLTGLVIVLFWIVPYIYDLFDKIKNLFSL